MVAGCIDRFLQPRKGLKTGSVVFPIHGLRPWLFMGIAPSGHVPRNTTPYLGKGALGTAFLKLGCRFNVLSAPLLDPVGVLRRRLKLVRGFQSLRGI